MGANGIGAVISGARLATRKTVVGLYRVIAICTALFGVALMVFAISRLLVVSLLVMVVVRAASCSRSRGSPPSFKPSCRPTNAAAS